MSKQQQDIDTGAEHPGTPPIAVVGVSALFPGSVDATGFWRDILAGTDLIGDVPPTHWLIDDYYDPDPATPDKTYARRGAFLGDIEFDALGWGVPPSVLDATDTSQLLALIVARQVLEDACAGQFEQLDRSRVSVILGATTAQELYGTMVSRLQRPVWVKALRESGLPEELVQQACDRIADHYVPWKEASFPGLLGNVVAGRIANRLDLGGTNCVTDAACASSFSALSMAVNELRLGQSDMVITGGVDTMNDILMYMCFSKTPAMSPSGDCRPFSQDADGTMLGEGLGMVALRRLADAERDGDRIYAVIKGLGTSSDGRATSVYAPVPAGQAQALRRAYRAAGYSPDTVELMEAHGTGTVAGDAAELESLTTVFAETGRQDQSWCALGSVKSQIGHTKAAAGAAGLFKVVLALHHRVLPPTIKVERPAPALEPGRSPFSLSTEARPWVRGSGHPRRASVSSFGFGGANYHVALQEYCGSGTSHPRLRTLPAELVVLGGDTPAVVAEQARRRAGETAQPGMLPWLAHRLQQEHRPAEPYRLAVLASSEEELHERLLDAARRIDDDGGQPFATPAGAHYGTGRSGDVALLFPGQGSQYLQMGAHLAMTFPAALAAWDQAADLPWCDENDQRLGLHQVVFPPTAFSDEERAAQQRLLTTTEWAQPAIGCHSLALLGLLRQLGLTPACAGGHSFGEVSALHAAGVLSASDLLRVARRRGELMAEAAAIPGAMTAVTRPVAEVRAVLEELDPAIAGQVVIANHNGPTQVVLSGATSAIAAVEQQLAAAGMSARRLPVATAFHSSLVAPSAEPFADFLAGIDCYRPEVPVYANATAAPYPEDSDSIRQTLARQIASPVRFLEMVEAMYAAGARTFIEVGPSAVLTGLVGKILQGRTHCAVALDRKGRDGVVSLLDGLARLIAAGVELQLAALADLLGTAEPADPRQRVAPKLSVSLTGANHGKPYPPPGGAPELPPPNPEQPQPTTTPAQPQPVTAPPPPHPQQSASEVHVASSKKPPQPAPEAPAAATPAWLQAFQEMQRQTAEAHTAYQQAMADSHTAFLRTAEASMAALTQLLHGPDAALEVPAARPAMVTQQADAHATAAEPALPPAMPAARPSAAEEPQPLPEKEPAAITATSGIENVRSLLLEVVAEKTGYPRQMLSLEMDLEQDLGIDSIKRVEILSAVVERAPELPEIDAEAMISLRTLGQIVEYLEQSVVALSTVPGPAATLRPDQVRSLLLEVVAEKTGYPQEMLSLEMDLEQDLGIDSIKRVEILSAVVERAPELPEIDAEAMISLRTLGQIVAYLEQSVTALVTMTGHAAPATPANDVPDLAERTRSVLLQVVAEKTGYPQEMLSLEMDLEQDLGIDSIKRVEILSAVVERAPDLHEVNAQVMIDLKTLGQIVDHLARQGGDDADAVIPDQTTPGQDVTSSAGQVLARYQLQEVPAPPLGLTLPGLLGHGTVFLVDDGQGIAPALAAVLGQRGIESEVVEQAPATAAGVVFLGGLRQVDSADEAMAVNRQAFRAARDMAVDGHLFVSVQDTGGSFGLGGCSLPQAYLGGLAGLAKTVAQERPQMSVKAIDLERGDLPPADVAVVLADELLGGGPQLEVGLPADGRRITLRSVAAGVDRSQPPLERGAVVVVSGGARGVTADCLVALAHELQPRLVLLGRTRVEPEPACCHGKQSDAELKQALLQEAQAEGTMIAPAELGRQARHVLATREIQKNLERMHDAGAEVRYLPVDVSDSAAVAAALNPVRREWGAITGLIHAAGIISDHLLADKSEEEYEQVLAPKVAGLRALLAATADDPLRLLCLFSSVAGRCGNAGQSDYAMANEILNKVAAAEQLRRGGHCLVKSLGWGPWQGGMVTPQLQARFTEQGVPLIPLQTGARMLLDEVCAGPDSGVEVVLGGEPQLAPPAGSGSGEQLSLDLLVDQHSHPYLVDHAIDGVPVVPVVLVMEWFARTAEVFSHDLHLDSLREVKVLRGIKLQHFSKSGGDRFSVHARQVATGNGVLSLALELCGSRGELHYRAVADLVPEPPRVNGSLPEVRLGSWDRHSIYDGDGALFHGPRFQMIRSVDGVSDEGMAATVTGVTEHRWSRERFRFDAAALDGGLQLALLWTEHMLGGAALPTGIDQVCSWCEEPPAGRMRCLLKGRSAGNGKTVCDVFLQDGDGRVVAALNGVENHLLPGRAN